MSCSTIKKASLSLFLITIFFSSGALYYLLNTKESSAFQNCTDESLSSVQFPQGSSKEIWITESPNRRLYHRIESKNSLLSLMPNKNKIDLVEQLRGVSCWLQKDIYMEDQLPMQELEKISAENGFYHYRSATFSAPSLLFSLFRIPVSATVDNSGAPLLTGEMDNFSFKIGEKEGKAAFLQARWHADQQNFLSNHSAQ